MIRLNNVSGAEYDPVTETSEPYQAPDEQTTTDQQSEIAALQASVLALANKIRTVTDAVVAATISDKTILADATTAPIIVNLPVAASTVGQIITVKKIDATANVVTLDPNGGELLDGGATRAISTQWSSLTIQCNGTAWFIL
jgi:hypothetical protein